MAARIIGGLVGLIVGASLVASVAVLTDDPATPRRIDHGPDLSITVHKGP